MLLMPRQEAGVSGVKWRESGVSPEKEQTCCTNTFGKEVVEYTSHLSFF